MALTAAGKAQVMAQYQRFPGDTGSPEVQIALWSAEIDQLNREHFYQHPKDRHSRRGLLRKVSRRHAQLRYLKRKDGMRYQQLIKCLGLRDKA